MMPLSARTQALLERARAEAAPSAEELHLLRIRLAASVAKEGPVPLVLPFLIRSLAGAAMLAALGSLGWLMTQRQQPAAAPVVMTATQPLESQPIMSCPAAPECPVAPARVVKCAPAAMPVAFVDHDALLAARKRLSEDVYSEQAARNDASPLELSLLIMGREALDENRPLDALGHADKHAQLFPTSAFEEERVAIELLAHCLAEHKDIARQRYQRLMELAPETTYLPRVKGTCGEDITTVETDDE